MTKEHSMTGKLMTKRLAVNVNAQSEREHELVSALNELNLAIKMLDQHILTEQQRHTMQHSHLKHMQIIAGRVLDQYDLR
jgi:hypothetical protein